MFRQTQLWLPRASLRSLALSVPKCILNLTWSRPTTGSLSLLDLSLHVHHCTRVSMASNYIFMQQRLLYGVIAITEVNRMTGRRYSADPGVDKHHLVSISSYHSMTIHARSFSIMVSLTLSEIPLIHVIAWTLNAGFYHIFSSNSYTSWTRTPFSHEFHLDVTNGAAEYWWWAPCTLAPSFYRNGLHMVHHNVLSIGVARCCFNNGRVPSAFRLALCL